MSTRLNQVRLVDQLYGEGLLPFVDAAAIVRCVLAPDARWKDGRFDFVGALAKCGLVVEESKGDL